MIDRKKLKDRAKAVMTRSYPKMLLACAIVYFLSSGGFGISTRRFKGINLQTMAPIKMLAIGLIIIFSGVIVIAVSVFVMEPLKVGLKKFMLQNARQDTSVNVLFAPFQNDYKNTVLVQFMRGLIVFLWSLIGIIPTIILEVFFGFAEKIQMLLSLVPSGAVMPVLELFALLSVWVVLTLVFSVPSIIKDLQYSMVPYIVAENTETDWKSAMNESKNMMVGNKWEYVKLWISFIPWRILAQLCCCIGNFFLLPYVEATFAEMYLEISGQNLTYTQYE